MDGLGRYAWSRAALLAQALAVVFAAAERAEAQSCAGAKPEWVFCDDFEASADADGQLGLWDDQGLGPQNLVIETDKAIVHGGARALRITAHKGKDTGGGPSKWFLPGYDEIYVRFWTRFATDYHYLHHMVFIGASEAKNKWAAFGTAGCRPSGTNFFVTQVEPFSESGKHAPPGAWGFYTYSNDMKCDPGATCANYADPNQICNDCSSKGSPCQNGLECCWGTNDIAAPTVIAKLGAWTCLEARVHANAGGQANGAQTLWVDGAQVGEWSGIRFRTDDALKLNSLGLWHYVTDDVYASGQTEETVWFDDVVVSTAPIGCGASGAPDGGVRDAGASASRDGGTRGRDASVGVSSGGTTGSPSARSAVGSDSGATATLGTGGATGASGARGASGSGGSAHPGKATGCGCRVAHSRSDALAWLLPACLTARAARRRLANRS